MGCDNRAPVAIRLLQCVSLPPSNSIYIRRRCDFITIRFCSCVRAEWRLTIRHDPAVRSRLQASEHNGAVNRSRLMAQALRYLLVRLLVGDPVCECCSIYELVRCRVKRVGHEEPRFNTPVRSIFFMPDLNLTRSKILQHVRPA